MSGEVIDDEPGSNSIFAGPVRAMSAGLITVVTLIAFEATAVAAALPTAARELDGLAAYGWAFTGYLVASVVGMVAAGGACDRRGPRDSIVAGWVAFVIGLLLAGTATTMTQLIAGRLVQGLGGGLLITAIYVVIGESYPDGSRPRLFAAMSSAWVVPSLVGPLLAGLVTQHASWRLAFLGLLPFALIGAALLLPVLRTMPVRRGAAGGTALRHRLLRAIAVALGIAALEAGGQHPSIAPALLAGGAVVALLALVWGLRGLLPRGTATVSPGVGAPIALRGLLAASFFAVESTVPLSLTLQHGFGPTTAALPLAAAGITWALGSWWQGRPGDEGVRRRVRLIRAGFALLTLGALGMALTVLPALPGGLAYPAWALAGAGAGLVMSSVGVLLLRYTTDADRGRDSAALQLADATTSAVTTGLAGILIAAATRGALGTTAAFVTLDVAMAAVAALGILLAGRARPAGPREPGRHPAAVAAAATSGAN